ncbi:xanthine dehydrogenase family protein molybdopterin-binding subunit [Ramlibacter rhizophilus]|uniref:Xanthine dehydrogenase family protein molybdopterin-binding subunit n=1 Tax=Ramlibacter rhizophilus TaxID=1781167 RepID=A0A4Z0BMC0_9BURK|nr:molybdopterin cofactor-binding domain-containing protein [Ramlibacter rhizophilus]TFY99543.1 xanthine dehydrogenase family protein molybdopterin-binding subunit [Ramlibacter rhizophilus]
MTATAVPEALRQHPLVGQWLRMGPDGRVQASSGKVDLGQGISHALRLIVAEELALEPDRIEMVRPTTATSPDEAVTSGSLSVQHSGAALRLAAAHLREACRRHAALRAGVDDKDVHLSAGAFVAGPHRLAYAELVDEALLQEPVDAAQAGGPSTRPSRWSDRPRPDVAQKVFGEFRFLHDLELPGMLRGRIFRPATLQARMDEDAWATLQPQLAAIPGVLQVVRDGLLVGVLAARTNALDRCSARVAKAPPWHEHAEVPQARELEHWLKSQPLDSVTLLEREPVEPGADAPGARVFRTAITRGWLQHASIGLCCAIARWEGEALQVWTHSQGIFNLRRDLALAFGMAPDAITVCHAEAAGCYGHNGADDVAFDAAWLARHAEGRPVRLEWTREQEMSRAPMGPAMTVEVEAVVGADGRLAAWTQSVWSQGHGTRPGRGATPALLGAWQTAQPFPVTMAVNAAPAAGGGADRNAAPPYAVPRARVLSHRVLSMPLRVSALRSLGAHVNVAAAEALLEDIAAALGRDPLQYRLDHLEDERARAVLRELARLCGWGLPQPEADREGFGRGIGFARYKNSGAWCAVAADLVVEERVKLRKLWIAADLGRLVHPDGVRNQLEGGALQAASWTLCEAAQVSAEGIRSADWESYPILGFGEAPPVEVSLLDRPEMPSLGAGECSCGPAAAAIGNAIHDALGLRLRRMPYTADALLEAAQAA